MVIDTIVHTQTAVIQKNNYIRGNLYNQPMKKIGLLLAGLNFFAISCSSDDSGDNNNSGPDTNFLPLATGNYWVYDAPGSLQSGRDSLYVANDTVIEGNTYKKIKTLGMPFGFFSGAMSNNSVRVSGDELLVSGSASVPFSEEFPVSISISDFVIFKEGASANTILDNVSDSFTQTYEGLPLEFDYKLSTRSLEDLPSYAINGEDYTNVKKVQTVLNLKISVSFEGIPIPVPILDAQDVVVSTQYYAQGIGVVHVVTDIQYELEDMPMPVPIPASGSEHQEEILEHYNVN